MWLKVLIFGALLSGIVKPENDSDCDIADIQKEEWTFTLKQSFYDNRINERIFESKYTGKIDNLKCVYTPLIPNDYVQFLTNASHCYMTTTDAMKNFDQDMWALSSSNPLYYRCTMNCKEASKQSVLVHELTVLDYNDYAPEFIKGDRNYLVAYPLMPLADFSNYGDKILATDLDFNNTDIKFEMSPDDFDVIVSVNTTARPYIYQADFRARKVMEITEPITYTLTATDSGTVPGPKSTSINITLNADPQYTLDVPSFAYPDSSTFSYSFRYEENNTLTVLKGPVVVKTEKSTVDDLKLAGDLSNHFEVTYDSASKQISLSVRKQVENPTEAFTVLSLSLRTDVETSTAIFVYFASVPSKSGPKFEQRFYTGAYDDASDSVSLDKPIKVTGTGDPQFDIAGDLADRFAVIQDSASKSYVIKVNQPLTAEEIKSNNYLNLTIEAAVDTDTDTCGLLISLPSHVLEFSQIIYAATYSDDNKVTIEEHHPIALRYDTGVSISVAENFSKYFNVSYTDKKYAIDVLENLPDDILEQTEISFVITATDKYRNLPQAVVKMALPARDVPEFEEVYYTAQYPKDGQGSFDFDTDISFDKFDDLSKARIEVVDYTDNFEISYSSTAKKWEIEILSPLDDALLDTQFYITTKLSATLEGYTQHPEATFVLNLPEKEVEEGPIFDLSYYRATYAVQETTAVVAFERDIGFTNKKNMSKISIVSDEYPAFSFVFAEGKWQMTSSLLNIDQLNTTDLVVSITAEDSTNKLTGHSVVDLRLPSVNTDGAPRFSKTYYTGRYLMSAAGATVVLDQDISISNKADVSKIKIATDVYTDNFNFTNTNGQWIITVVKNLDQSVLNTNRDIVMALIASEDLNAGEIGQSALVLTLPIINTIDAPKFDRIFYNSSCNSNTDLLNVEINITNKNDLSEVEVSILEDAYKPNFEVLFNKSISLWYVHVKSMPSALLPEQNDLLLTLTAKEKGNDIIGQAALIINFPVIPAPVFSKDQYYGNYTDGSPPVFTMEDIVIGNKNDRDDIGLSLSSIDGDFSSNFNFSYDNKRNAWKMTLKSPIDAAKIKDKTELVFTLSASEKGNDRENEGKTTLIIYLPNTINTNDVEFTEVHYTGCYDNSGDKPTVEILGKSIQIRSSKDISTATVDFESTDTLNPSDYFNLTKNADHYEVTVRNNLPDDILASEKSLVMTLVAKLDAAETYATLVIELPVETVEKTVTFDSPLYDGEYAVDIDGDVQFTADDITLVSVEDADDIDLNITDDSIYGEYFQTNVEGKKVKLSKKTNLPAEVYKKENSITLKLVAKIAGSTTTSSSVVNIKIKYEVTQESLKFGDILYNGMYETKDKAVNISTDDINLATAYPDKVEIVITNAYKDFFNVSYASPVVTLSLLKPLSDDTLKNASAVTVLLKASLENTDIEDRTVVNLRIIDDDQPTPEAAGVVAFDSPVNSARYSLVNDKGEFKVDGDIGMTTDRTNDEIVTSIEDESGLKDYFSSSYSNQKFEVKLSQDLPKDVYLSKSFVSIILKATITDTGVYANSVLTIKFDKDQIADDRYISFASPVYAGVYEIQNNSARIPDVEKIEVNTNEEDVNITISITNGYDKYFETSYSNKKISLKLVDDAADSQLRSLNNIPVALLAEIKNSLHNSTTVVNFKVKDDDSEEPKINSTLKFPEVLYHGKYTEENGFTVDDINIITDRTENEIEVKLSNGQAYVQYFSVSYSHTKVTVALSGTLPDGILEETNFIELILEARAIDQDPVSAVLNIEIDSSHGGGGKSLTGRTGYVVTISVLSVLLLLLLVGVVAFYFLKFRRSKPEKEPASGHVKFEKTSNRASGDKTSRSSAIDTRRPTGFIFDKEHTDDNDSRESTTESPPSEMKERRKSVAFDDNVEKKEVETVNDDDDVDTELDRST